MAKYSRFDPRNKNHGRNKQLSIDRYTRIREAGDSSRKPLLREVVNDYDSYYEEENQFLTESDT